MAVEPQKNRIKIKISAPTSTFESDLKQFQKFQFRPYDLNDALSMFAFSVVI
jgi:hypothetical protein